MGDGGDGGVMSLRFLCVYAVCMFCIIEEKNKEYTEKPYTTVND